MQEAKLFKNGQSQAVRLPKEFRFSGKSVYINKLGSCVVLLPKDDPWRVMEQACDQFSSDFMSERDQGAHEREDLSL